MRALTHDVNSRGHPKHRQDHGEFSQRVDLLTHQDKKEDPEQSDWKMWVMRNAQEESLGKKGFAGPLDD